jgi:hypothetical protein
MPITTGSFAKALWPGINKWFGEAYQAWPDEYKDLFDISTSTKAYEEEVGVSGFGLPVETSEGGAVTYDTARQSWTMRYQHKKYMLGFVVTREAYEDNQYDLSVLGKKNAQALKFAMKQGMEVICANIYNRAFTSGYTYGDGVILCSNAHPTSVGGTFSNIPSVNADISEASLEQACIDIGGFTDDRGLQISMMPDTLHIHRSNMFEVERILKSTLQNDTANNALNALKSTGMFKGGVKVNHYFTDADAWFIRTNCPDGMKLFMRKPLTFSMDDEFDTDNAKYKAVFRMSAGVTDPRGIYGCQGA